MVCNNFRTEFRMALALRESGIESEQHAEDSTVDGVEEWANLALRFSAAYIHESEGKPDVDVGARWV